MKSFSVFKMAGPVLMAAFVLVITGADYTGDGPQAQLLKQIKYDQRLNEKIPMDVPFRDSTGESVTLAKYFGDKPIVLAFVYYECPMLCTLVLNGLTKSMKGLPFNIGKEFEVVVISFDARETPELASQKKKTYVRRYGRAGAAEGWHFLTGEPESIEAITDAVGFKFVYDEEREQFAHASGIVVLTPGGKIARYFYGVDYAPRDLKLGLVEASKGKIGSFTDQVLLFCYHYDPTTGKYGFMIMNILRLGGLLTLLALGSFIFISLRRDKAKAGV